MIKKILSTGVVPLLIFVLIISITQSLILKPHLQFGFSPDDVGLTSDYISLGANPLLKFNEAWRLSGGPHIINPEYYIGILNSFFGFNYPTYQTFALIIKILSIISFYLLIKTLFRNNLLAFIGGLIYSMHYGAVGALEMVSRSQDYLVITGLNIFLILFYYIERGKLKEFYWKIIAALILFSSFFINPIRAYPILPFIVLIEFLNFLNKKSKDHFYKIGINLFIFFLPFLLFLLLVKGSSGASLGNFLTTLQKASEGNLQILLTPITTLGSLFLTGDSLKLLSLSLWSSTHYFKYLFFEASIIFGAITLFLSFFISKKYLKFFLSVFLVNFILEALLFIFIDRGLGLILPTNIQMHYDLSYLPPTILGLYLLVLTFFIFLEWFKDQKNIFLSLYLLGMLFAAVFIIFTWIFQDYVYIAVGINGYSTIPSMGISAAFSSIILLIYTNLKNKKNLLKYLAPLTFLILLPYFTFSNSLIQDYLQKNIKNGNSAPDQIRLRDKFWSYVKDPSSCDKFFFLDTKGDYDNGYFYSFISIDRFEKWYNLYSPHHSTINCPVAYIVSDEEKLQKSYSYKDNEAGFIYKDTIGKEKFYPLKNFYALKFHNRDVLDIKQEILTKISH